MLLVQHLVLVTQYCASQLALSKTITIGDTLNSIFSIAATSPLIITPTHCYLESSGQAVHVETHPHHTPISWCHCIVLLVE